MNHRSCHPQGLARALCHRGGNQGWDREARPGGSEGTGPGSEEATPDRHPVQTSQWAAARALSLPVTVEVGPSLPTLGKLTLL